MFSKQCKLIDMSPFSNWQKKSLDFPDVPFRIDEQKMNTRFSPKTRHSKDFHTELVQKTQQAQDQNVRFAIGPLACAVLNGCHTCVTLLLRLQECPTEALEDLHHAYLNKPYVHLNPGQQRCYDHLVSTSL